MLRHLARYLRDSRQLQRLGWRARIAIVIFAFPVLLALAAIAYSVEASVFLLRSEVVPGTVVERYEWSGETIFDKDSINYEPVFTYLDGGQERRASVGSAHASFDLEIGEVAAIRAVPGSSGNVRLDTWQGVWFLPVVLSVMAGAALVVAGLIWAILNRVFFRKGGA